MGKPVVRSAKAVPGSKGGSTGGVKSKDGKAGKAGKAVGKTVGKHAFQQRPGAATAGKKGFSSAEKKSAKKKQSADVYELDDDEMTDKKKRDELRRFAGVDIYEYEQPEHFDDGDDEEIDEDEAFGEDDFDRYGDVGVKKKKGSRFDVLTFTPTHPPTHTRTDAHTHTHIYTHKQSFSLSLVCSRLLTLPFSVFVSFSSSPSPSYSPSLAHICLIPSVWLFLVTFLYSQLATLRIC